jgi:hypothetical protein
MEKQPTLGKECLETLGTTAELKAYYKHKPDLAWLWSIGKPKMESNTGYSSVNCSPGPIINGSITPRLIGHLYQIDLVHSVGHLPQIPPLRHLSLLHLIF